EPAVKELVFSAAMPKEQLLRTAIRAVYDVRGDDLRMRNSLEKTTNLAANFDALRKNYPMRRDINCTRVNALEVLVSAGFAI
ncbi:MAG: DUF3410 domain-containing protein, partial [Venatoribacter sp.]